jgi:hypothetical protein
MHARAPSHPHTHMCKHTQTQTHARTHAFRLGGRRMDPVWACQVREQAAKLYLLAKADGITDGQPLNRESTC